MCQLDWALGHPNTCLDIILGVPVRIFLDEINIWTHRLGSLENTLMLGKAGGEGDDKGRDGWMASPTRWTWVWTNSGSWWWTGKPGMLQSMESQRVGHAWATELNWWHARHYARSSTFIPVWNPHISLIQEALRSFGVTEPTGNRVPTCKLRPAGLQNLFFEGQ